MGEHVCAGLTGPLPGHAGSLTEAPGLRVAAPGFCPTCAQLTISKGVFTNEFKPSCGGASRRVRLRGGWVPGACARVHLWPELTGRWAGGL